MRGIGPVGDEELQTQPEQGDRVQGRKDDGLIREDQHGGLHRVGITEPNRVSDGTPQPVSPGWS